MESDVISRSNKEGRDLGRSTHHVVEIVRSALDLALGHVVPAWNVADAVSHMWDLGGVSCGASSHYRDRHRSRFEIFDSRESAGGRRAHEGSFGSEESRSLQSFSVGRSIDLSGVCLELFAGAASWSAEVRRRGATVISSFLSFFLF